MKRELINTALNNLLQNTGINGRFTPEIGLDGVLYLKFEDKETMLVVEVKKELRRHQLLQLNVYKQRYHIVPQIDGELEVLEIFWKPQDEIAPPIIIYAELMLKGGKRNKETAEKIYNEYIQPIL